jgi:hypothetical protein
MIFDGPHKHPVNFGEKIVILGAVTEQFRPIVSYMEWRATEARWEIELLWESGDESRVYSSDRGKYWLTEEEYFKRQQRQITLN